jgi:ABC-type transport system substrate-binding protein
VRPIPESGARLTAVQSDIEIATNIAPEQLAQVEADSELALVMWPTTRQIFVGMHNLKEPFTDPLVRQALNYAIDWEAISESIYQGMAEPIGGPVTPTSFGHSAVSPFSYDPDKARDLLTQAGLGDGFSVTFTATNGSYLKDFELEQVLQQQLGAIGVTIDIQVVEFARYIELVRQPTVTSELVMWIDSWASDTAASTLRDRYHCDSLRPDGVNITGYCNELVDPLIEEAEQTLDDAARQAPLDEAQELVAADAPSIWGVVQQAAWAASVRVHDAVHGQDEGVWVNEKTWLAAE